MRKSLTKLLIIITMVLINISGVKAQTHTFDDVLELLKNDQFVKMLETDDIKFVPIELEEHYHYLNLESETDHEIYISTEITVEDDIISYQYLGNKDLAEETTMKTMIDATFLTGIISSVAKLNGYSDDDVINLLKNDEILKEFTLEKNGLEMTFWDIEQKEESSYASITAFDTFKININNLKLELDNKTEQNPEQPEDKKEENTTITTEIKNEIETTITPNPENPSTGISIPSLSLGVLGLISIVCLFISNKNKRFIKL